MKSISILIIAIMLFSSGSAQAQPATAGLSEYAQKEASAGTGFLGEEDYVDLGSAKVYFTAPKGWVKEANVQVSNGAFFYFLKYKRAANDNTAVIFLTGIQVAPKDTEVLAYSKQIVNGLRTKSPDDVIVEPKAVKVKKIDAAYFERTSPKDSSFWARYQFLVAGRVLKLQLMDTKGVDKKDLALLHKLAKSIRIEQKGN